YKLGTSFSDDLRVGGAGFIKKCVSCLRVLDVFQQPMQSGHGFLPRSLGQQFPHIEPIGPNAVTDPIGPGFRPNFIQRRTELGKVRIEVSPFLTPLTFWGNEVDGRTSPDNALSPPSHSCFPLGSIVSEVDPE